MPKAVKPKSIGERLAAAGASTSKPKPIEPLWLGPSDESDRGGVTQSLLQKFIACRERFRIQYILGLQVLDQFKVSIEYGNMWHACEEATANNLPWTKALFDYTRKLQRQYPLQQEQVVHWKNVCMVQFPLYLEYWEHHPDVVDRKPIAQEYKFDVWHTLPSGRRVRLRGKFDAVDVIVEQKKAAVFIQENKTKSEVDQMELTAQLNSDLQNTVYTTALQETDLLGKLPFGGVRYNVIRRPLSGGKGSIRKHKEKVYKTKVVPAETDEQFYARLRDEVIIPANASLDNNEHYFHRWKIRMGLNDVKRSQQRILNPILEQLCVWYDWMKTVDFDPWQGDTTNNIHWQHPHGVYNVTNEGGRSDVEAFLETGSTTGLSRASTMFPELQ